MQENMNSTELQSYKTAVLNGIGWSMKQDAENGTELHIGQVGNYQIYLSESPNLTAPDGTRTYTISLWEMSVKTRVRPMAEMNTDKDVLVVRPGFTQLVTDAVIHAADMDGAKLAAVDYIMAWNDDRRSAANAEFVRLSSTFESLPDIYSRKVVAAKSTESVRNLGISGAAVNALFANGIHVIGELAAVSVKELKAMKGLGGTRGQEVLFAMKSLGVIMRAQ